MIWNSETLKCSCCWHSTFLISSLLDFLFSVLLSSHSNSENHSCSFLKFHEYMRICPIWWEYHFYQQTGGIAMGGPASSTTAEIYMQAYEQHCTLQKFGKDLLMMFILSLNIRIWKTFSIITTFIKILSLL